MSKRVYNRRKLLDEYREWLENALPFKKRIEWALEQTGGKGEYASEFKTALERLNRASQGK